MKPDRHLCVVCGFPIGSYFCRSGNLRATRLPNVFRTVWFPDPYDHLQKKGLLEQPGADSEKSPGSA